MKKISINVFSESSINNAIAELKAYKEKMNRQFSDGVLETMANARETADNIFQGALYSGDNDVSTTLEASGNTVKIVAHGQSVAFIEFGTGIVNGAYGGKIPDNVSGRGQYGQGKGSNEHWVYEGNPGNNGRIIRNDNIVLTHGDPPAEAMLTARNEIVERITETVRSKFND